MDLLKHFEIGIYRFLHSNSSNLGEFVFILVYFIHLIFRNRYCYCHLKQPIFFLNAFLYSLWQYLLNVQFFVFDENRNLKRVKTVVFSLQNLAGIVSMFYQHFCCWKISYTCQEFRVSHFIIPFRFICIYSLHTYSKCLVVIELEQSLKDVIRNRFNFILEERVKFSEQNSENLMKIGWKIRRLWNFEISQIFKKQFLTSRYMNMQMSELMMSSPHNFPFTLYTEMTKISYFS